MNGKNKSKKRDSKESVRCRAEILGAGEKLEADEIRYETLIESLPQKIFYKNKDLIYVSINENFARDLKIRPGEAFGKTDYDFFPKELADKHRAEDLRIMKAGRPEDIEESLVQEGETRFVHKAKTPVRDNKGRVVGILGIFWDITKQKRAEEELIKHRDHLEEMVKERTVELEAKSEIISRQAKEILEVSTPVLQVWQGVVIAPLIGNLDSQRAQQFMEKLLDRIVETDSQVALIDITGVPTIDTQTAQYLIDTISTVSLLGAQVILTGVRSTIAQTIVHLGVDLSGIITRSSLAAGLLVAMDSLGLKVSSSADSGESE